MKALVKKKAEAGLWLDDVPVPEIGINEVLIKIQKTAICGTRQRGWEGESSDRT